MDIFLKSGNILYLIAAIIISAAAAYLYYRKSNLNSPKKFIFPVVKFFSTFFILALFLTPVLSFINNDSPASKNIFLIDVSKSLTIEDRFRIEADYLKDKIPGGSKVFSFADGLLREVNDSIQNSTGGVSSTNLFKTINSLSSFSPVNSINIISDGNVNDGGNPADLAKSFNTPVSYILTGDTAQKKDALVKNIYVNKNAFIDSKVIVKAEVNAYFINGELKVSLFEEENRIESKTLAVNEKSNLYEVEFNVSSGTEGIKKYKVKIDDVKDEITYKNNVDYFFINFHNNKFKILIYSGSPSADYAYLKEIFSSINNFQPVFQTQKSSSEFYETTVSSYKDFDAIVFAGFPVQQTNTALLNDIKAALDKNSTPLIFMESRNIDYTKLELFKENLPVSILNHSNTEAESQLKLIQNSGSEFTKSSDFNLINSAPSIFINLNSYSVKPGAESFLISSKNSQPAAIILNSEKKSSAAFLFHGFYKLRLNKQNDFTSVLSKIISSSIFSISSKDKKKILDFELSKNVSSANDDVILRARIKNASEINSPSVKVTISSGSFNNEIELKKINSEYFEGVFTPQNEGDYKLTAGLYSAGSLVDASPQRLLAGENNLEFKKTNSDKTLLSELAASTGGRNLTGYSKSQIQSYLDSVSNSKTYVSGARKDFNLKFNPYFLSLVIFFLCLEWFLRKRNNLS